MALSTLLVEAVDPDTKGGEPVKILTFDITGTGRRPRLQFEAPEVVLPAVPIGVQSSAVFYIENDGYDNLDLKYRLPADTVNVPLSVEFPEVRWCRLRGGAS